MKNLSLVLLALLFAFFSLKVNAQQSAILEEYVRAGLTNNLALRQQNIDLQKSLEAVRQAKSLFYPTVQFNASYTRAVGGRSIDFPIRDLLQPVYDYAQIPVQLENQTIQFLPDNFQETKLKIAYPLFNTDLRHNREIREHLVESQVAQKAAYEHELRYSITEAYLQYLQAKEAEKIWLGAKNVLTELRRFNESLVRNNVATRDIVATADYELSKAEQEIFQLQSVQNTARAYFNYLINRDLQTEVVADTALLRSAVPVYSPDELIRQAMVNRQEFAALDAGLAASESSVRLNEANRILPDLYVGAELGFQGFGYKFNGDQAYALGQVGLTYDLYNGGQARSKVQQARLETEKIRVRYDEVERQITLQVTQAWNEFEAARQGWQTAQTGLRAAEESFRIVNNKYRASQALLLEFLDAQNRVTTARMQVLLAWTEVLLKEAELRKAAGI